MQTKTYFATSVPAAMEVARKELGPDAMLVSSRPSPADVRAFGRLEVTFAFDPQSAQLPVPYNAPPPALLPAPAPSSGRVVRSELDEIRQQIAALKQAVGQSATAAPGPAMFGDYLNTASAALEQKSPEKSPNDSVVVRLCANGLGQEMARSIAAAAAQTNGDPQTALVDEIAARVKAVPFGELKPGETRTLAFMGPAGRGKTTSLVKIAVRYGLAKRVPVRIYSAGAHGIGGQEQLARYAAVLGVPFNAFESLDSLHLTLNGDSWKGLILIDTPGMSRADQTEMTALAGFFNRRPEIEKHLVLRADARSADTLHMVSSFSALKPSRLLFTGLDEALTLGAMVEVLAQTAIPASFAGTGQQIPEGIEDASAVKLARAVCVVNMPAAAFAAAA